MATQIQKRRDTAENWTNANPVLAQGEEGFETDTNKTKIGDGVTAWTSLAYEASGGGGGVSGITSDDGSLVVTGSVTPYLSRAGITGDVLIPQGSDTATLVTIGSAATTGDAQHVAQITTDIKGRVTAASAVTVNDTTKLPLTGGTLTGALNLGANQINDIGAPTSSTDAATKAYVDSTASGVSVHSPVNCATTTTLPTNTYNNGTSGVGATLTANANGVLTVDGHAVVLNDRVLVRNEATQANDGIYLCTTAGTSGVPYVLTRATDQNTGTQFPAAYTFVLTGTTNGSTSWLCTNTGTVTVGTTAITWVQFSAAPNAVTSVSATDTSIVVTGTTTPALATGTLDVIATQHPPAANWSNNSKKITSLANGSLAQDAAAFGQIPTSATAIGGLEAGVTGTQTPGNLSDVGDVGYSRFNLSIPTLSAVAAVATSNINIASPGASIDGYSFQTNDEVLLTAQTTASTNGVYIWNGATSALSRPKEFPSGGLVKRGRTVMVANGTLNANTVWTLTAPAAGLTIDTTAQTWIGPPGQWSATTGGNLNGGYRNVLGVTLGASPSVTAGTGIWTAAAGSRGQTPSGMTTLTLTDTGAAPPTTGHVSINTVDTQTAAAPSQGQVASGMTTLTISNSSALEPATGTVSITTTGGSSPATFTYTGYSSGVFSGLTLTSGSGTTTSSASNVTINDTASFSYTGYASGVFSGLTLLNTPRGVTNSGSWNVSVNAVNNGAGDMFLGTPLRIQFSPTVDYDGGLFGPTVAGATLTGPWAGIFPAGMIQIEGQSTFSEQPSGGQLVGVQHAMGYKNNSAKNIFGGIADGFLNYPIYQQDTTSPTISLSSSNNQPGGADYACDFLAGQQWQGINSGTLANVEVCSFGSVPGIGSGITAANVVGFYASEINPVGGVSGTVTNHYGVLIGTISKTATTSVSPWTVATNNIGIWDACLNWWDNNQVFYGSSLTTTSTISTASPGAVLQVMPGTYTYTAGAFTMPSALLYNGTHVVNAAPATLDMVTCIQCSPTIKTYNSGSNPFTLGAMFYSTPTYKADTISVSGGTQYQFYAVPSFTTTGGGTFTGATVENFHSGGTVNIASSTITEWDDFHASALTYTAGTITTHYGLNVDLLTAATTNIPITIAPSGGTIATHTNGSQIDIWNSTVIENITSGNVQFSPLINWAGTITLNHSGYGFGFLTAVNVNGTLKNVTSVSANLSALVGFNYTPTFTADSVTALSIGSQIAINVAPIMNAAGSGTFTGGSFTGLQLGGNPNTTGNVVPTWTHINITNPTGASAHVTNQTGISIPSLGAATLAIGINNASSLYQKGAMVASNNVVTVSSNAGTVASTAYLSTFTNSSAATMTITMSTSGAVDGQISIVRIYDFSAAAETITWVNTENGEGTAPTTSNGSTTLPKTVTFMFNGQTSKWRCLVT